MLLWCDCCGQRIYDTVVVEAEVITINLRDSHGSSLRVVPIDRIVVCCECRGALESRQVTLEVEWSVTTNRP